MLALLEEGGAPTAYVCRRLMERALCLRDRRQLEEISAENQLDLIGAKVALNLRNLREQGSYARASVRELARGTGWNPVRSWAI